VSNGPGHIQQKSAPHSTHRRCGPVRTGFGGVCPAQLLPRRARNKQRPSSSDQSWLAGPRGPNTTWSLKAQNPI